MTLCNAFSQNRNVFKDWLSISYFCRPNKYYEASMKMYETNKTFLNYKDLKIEDFTKLPS